jgi:hypothetical protein
MRCLDKNDPRDKQWMWHNDCPDGLIHQHEVYRKHLFP